MPAKCPLPGVKQTSQFEARMSAFDPKRLSPPAASYVDRILRGDKPADLPVQAPTKFGTTVNLRTAKALNTAFTRRFKT